ncbi:hypothetical protein M427DRAFT_61416 [Gonapodya prolifera JEL478]|uniref:Uncharacterized protein n=1 Tax=Gonapodya prolifera (strain JEL478) TaxID=1344416 RepID=A0A139A2E1_GONPJ|nr:hypothetical protein M427DRAFT_61416 [Gonapodya prolifera JEL478]|eukprot:KXS10904.1 hypothetical protein M427DRAFT_61416 [Gonapodya prolifera JEL478]
MREDLKNDVASLLEVMERTSRALDAVEQRADSLNAKLDSILLSAAQGEQKDGQDTKVTKTDQSPVEEPKVENATKTNETKTPQSQA